MLQTSSVDRINVGLTFFDLFWVLEAVFPCLVLWVKVVVVGGCFALSVSNWRCSDETRTILVA